MSGKKNQYSFLSTEKFPRTPDTQITILYKITINLLELGRFSKNGRSPIFRFYVSLFPISDSDFYSRCSQQRVWQRLLPTIQSAVPLDW